MTDSGIRLGDTVKVTAGDLVGLLGKVVESSEATVKI